MAADELVLDLGVCSCCLLALANDDTTGHDANCSDGLEPLRLLGGAHVQLIAVGDELGFTWADCPGCGALAGDRFRIIGFGPA